MINKCFHFFKYKVGIDQAIFWATINKAFGFVRGPLLLYFIINYLTPKDQGLWYAFINLSMLSILAEMGFTTLITQFVSHEFAKLRIQNGLIEGEEKQIDRFFSLIKFAIKMYFVIIPIAIIILIIAGCIFFNEESLLILISWIIFSITGGINIFIGLFQSIYQGLDKVKEMQINALILSAVTTFFTCVFLILNLNIWALIFSYILGAIFTILFLYISGKSFWRQLVYYKGIGKYFFFKEIVPLQWRYAISWISGFFIFYFTVPVFYKSVGPVESGQLGMTLSLLAVIMGIASNWLNTKIPKLNILVSNSKTKEMKDLFRSSALRGFLILIGLNLCFIVIIIFLNNYYPKYAIRFLSVKYLTLIIVYQLSNYIVFSLSVYLRAHKIEPFVWLSFLNAVLTTLTLFIVLKLYGQGVFFVSLVIFSWLVILPLALYIYIKKEKLFQLQYGKF